MNLSSIGAAISRSSLADSVYETLLEAIVSGQLASGTVLTSVALAKQLDVSRTPVQEAMRRLAANGLIECPTGRRAQVARFTREDAVEIYTLRKLLEGESAARAATRIATDELTEIRRQIETLLASSEGVDWSRRALDCDIGLHEQLASAAENRRLREDIQRYRLLVRSFCRMVGTVANLRQAAQEHLRIVEALEQRDPQAAREAMHRHITARLESVLRDVFSEPAS